jgi:hypothetical protein
MTNEITMPNRITMTNAVIECILSRRATKYETRNLLRLRCQELQL